MKFRLTIALALLVGGLTLPAGNDMARSQGQTPPKFSEIAPILARYCNGCHSGDKPKAGLDLARYKTEEDILKHRKVWEKVVHNVRTREMPPKGKSARPGEAEIDRLARFVVDQLAKIDCSGPIDPGRVTIRRLNRTEYNNTIRDLVGVDFKPAADFPSDDIGYGFDNIGDVLSLSPLLMEKYLTSAEGIVDAAFADPAIKKRILIAEPAGRDSTLAAFKVLDPFARRAYRRPVTPEEVGRLVQLVRLARDQGESFESGVKVALQAVLVSPHFLFRIEKDEQPNNPSHVHLISEHELATRLSYFLWSSMPDDELFRLAGAGQLRQELTPQVRRMLQSPKSRALTENFAGQWLQIRNLATVTPDPRLFPSFDRGGLRRSMQRETELFFEAIVKEDRSIFDLLDADFTFVNERLAQHYGIPGVTGREYQRVKLPDNRRGGILTMASVLTITSNPTRTSPVKRGKWILENILGTPPPPPAPDAGDLEQQQLKGTLRQQMEQHRANPSCAVCHQRMDPLGFAFENFDAIGAWRDRDGSQPIDPSGLLPEGQKFNGPAELKAILKKQDDLFRRCLAEKMLTYALGRGLEYYDKCAIDRIAETLAKNHDKMSSLIVAIVLSDPFQKRRGKD